MSGPRHRSSPAPERTQAMVSEGTRREDDHAAKLVDTDPTVSVEDSKEEPGDNEQDLTVDNNQTTAPDAKTGSTESDGSYTLEPRERRTLRGRKTDLPFFPPVTISLPQAKELLVETRKRAAGWGTGSTSLVALIVASLALRSTNDWMSTFSGIQLYGISVLVAIALGLSLVSMWYTLKAAHGPYRLDTRARDYYTPHDAQRIFERAQGAADDLKCGQKLLWTGVVVFCLAAFASWLLNPVATTWWTLR